MYIQVTQEHFRGSEHNEAGIKRKGLVETWFGGNPVAPRLNGLIMRAGEEVKFGLCRVDRRYSEKFLSPRRMRNTASSRILSDKEG